MSTSTPIPAAADLPRESVAARRLAAILDQFDAARPHESTLVIIRDALAEMAALEDRLTYTEAAVHHLLDAAGGAA